MVQYIDKINNSIDNAIEKLIALGAPKELLQFGGEGAIPTKAPRAPGDARSEFLANRAMGDWAEGLFASSLQRALPQHTVCHYGDSDRIAAGADGFKEFFLARLEDVRLRGKRPDLLVFPRSVTNDSDLTGQSTEELTDLVKKASAAIEVRSSKVEALHYMKVKADRKAGKKLNDKDFLSFTVKIEDLRIVHRWIERHNVPQAYVQVFFDSIYALSVHEIFSIIASGTGFRLERPDKSQGKNTIMIPISSGTRIDTQTTMPDFAVKKRRTELGRHDAYVVPTGGKTKIDQALFWKAIAPNP
jgi:hypothetical protein